MGFLGHTKVVCFPWPDFLCMRGETLEVRPGSELCTNMTDSLYFPYVRGVCCVVVRVSWEASCLPLR